MSMTLGRRVSRSAWQLGSEPALRPLIEGEDRGFLTGMLSQDIGNLRYQRKVHVVLESVAGTLPDDAQKRLRGLLNDFRLHQSKDLDRIVGEFISNTAAELLLHGRATFELHANQEQSGAAPVPHLTPLPGWSIRARAWGVRQAQSSGEKVEWVPIPRRAVVAVSVDRSSLRGWRKGVAVLRSRDARRSDGLGLAAAQGQVPGYDFKLHHERMNLLTARGTRQLGWDGRGLYTEAGTSTYRMYRRLRFTLTCSYIAAAAVKFLNEVISRPDVFGDYGFSVLVEGLRTPAEVLTKIDDLLTGRLSHDEVFAWLMEK